MKIQIRRGVFETNSSSVHSMTVVDKSVYDAWVKGEMKYDEESGKFLPNDKADLYNIDVVNMSKNSFCMDFTEYIESDFDNPIVCELIIAKELINSNYCCGYLSYKRFIHCMEYITDNFKWMENDLGNGKVDFGYEGYR